MALTRIGGWRDFLLGAIIPDPTSGGKGTVDIQAVTLVDQTGASVGSSSGGTPTNFNAEGVIARSANGTPQANGTLVPRPGTLVGAAIVRPYSIPEADWQSNLSLANTSPQVVKAAGGAGVKTYLTAFQFSGVSTTVATSLTLLDAATIIWSGNILAGASFQEITFPTPLQTIANDALNVVLGTTPVGAIAFNAQGYQAAD